MRLRLSGGCYHARSIISSAQRQVNLFSEKSIGGAIVDMATGASVGTPEAGGITSGLLTLYPTPGLLPLGALPPIAGKARGLYWANSGDLYYCCGPTLYRVNSDWSFTVIGTIAAGSTPVSMQDNGQFLVLVDGSPSGYQVDLASYEFRAINGTPYPVGNAPTVASTMVYGFYGANRVATIDGYMLFNQPGTRNFYCTYNNELVFDSLYIAAKAGYADDIAGIVVNQRSVWMIGLRTTEIWFDAGAADFPFAIMPGPFINHGCQAPFSIAQINESIYWLEQDQAGANIVVRSQGYAVVRVSTHAIETAWAAYPATADATAFCFQHAGHVFYQINFPSADASWRFDETTGEWHEAVWTDPSGGEHRHRAACAAWAYGRNVCADWQTGQLYALDAATYTDAGAPILRIRDFPHLVADGKRLFYQQFLLDMAVGQSVGTSDPPGPFPLLDGPDGGALDMLAGPAPLPDTSPQVLLSWSDDRGRTFGNPVAASLGATGEYLTSIQYQRLGMARDRVFRVQWDAPVETALQGAFVTFRGATS